MEYPSPTEVLESGLWSSALFTTYALSLSFFESVVLRRLRSAGCREIWVVVDADGYRSSLMERRSSRVGQEYRLIPVALPRGVFHPKCTYLAGKGNDVLMVGSGNLTFGGYGRNVEVLEVLQSEREPGVFPEFADFLDTLAKRADFMNTESGWLERFSGLARKAGASASTTQPQTQPTLLHCVTQSVLDQYTGIVEQRGRPSHITVLSPFHDHDGGVLRELVERTGCPRLSIGLPTDPDDESAFPFQGVQDWPCAVDALRPDIPEPSRTIHAKWISASIGETELVLTGSVNATRKSFGGTDNIEVAVLRSDLPEQTRIAWQQEPPPAEQGAISSRPAGLGNTCILYAKLTSAGNVEGNILTLHPVAGSWSGRLQTPSGDTFAFDAIAGDDGRFSSEAPVREDFWFHSSVQVELFGENCAARGWLHQEEILRSQHIRGLNIASLIRLINREETEDDDVALLDYLAVSLADHLNVFEPRANLGSARGKTRNADEAHGSSIPIEFLRPSEQTADGGLHVHQLTEAGDPLHRLFSHLRKRLLAQSVSRNASHSNGGPEHSQLKASPGDDDGDPSDLQRIQSALEYFDTELRALLEDAPMAMRRSLLVVWYEVSLHMLLRRMQDPEHAQRFLAAWFWQATGLAVAAGEWQALEDHVVTAATLLENAADPGSEAPQQIRSRIHEGLERFFKGGAFAKQAQSSFESGTSSGFALLFGVDLQNRRRALERIVETRTLRQHLLAVLSDYVAGKPPPTNSPIFEGKAGQALRSALTRQSGKQRIFPLNSDGFYCPHCYRDLGSEAGTFRLRRVVVCNVCGRIVVRLKP